MAKIHKTNGRISINSKGTTTITASTEINGKTFSTQSTLNVVEATVNLGEYDQYMQYDETKHFTANIEPSNALNVSEVSINWYRNSDGINISNINGKHADVSLLPSAKPFANLNFQISTRIGDSYKYTYFYIIPTKDLGYIKTALDNNTGENVVKYYEDSNDEEGAIIDESNAGNYIGKEVRYTPSNPNSSVNPSTSGYKIFYIDLNGDYGDKGTVYLRVPYNDTRKFSSFAGNPNTVYNNLDSSKNKMAILNPKWNTADGNIDTMYEKLTAYLCNTDKWTGYLDEAGIGKFAVGGPSIEMWVDSYNLFIDYNKNNLTKAQVANNKQLSGKLETKYGTNGYLIGLLGDNYSYNSGTSLEDGSLINANSNSSYSSKIYLYYRYQWNTPSSIASPSNNSAIMACYRHYISSTSYDSWCDWNPLIACNENKNIEILE